MKNFIFINYNIKVLELYDKYFFINNQKIIIKRLNNIENIKELFNLTNTLYFNKFMVNTFITNINGDCYTKYDDGYIVLLKENECLYDFNINYLDKLINNKSYLSEINVIEVWKKEIDELENKIIEYKNDNKLCCIEKNVDFFIGLGENAIQLVSNIQSKKNNYLCHNLNIYTFNIINLNNPFNFINTNYTYDIAIYIRKSFYFNKINFDDYNYYFEKFDEYDSNFFFACLLFPTEYIYIVDKYLNNELDIMVLTKYISKINKYIEFLKYIKKKLNKSREIILINWL